MISVIVPVYNGRLTLDACLKAVYRSKGCPGFEVIVVDDGSTDSSPEVAAKYPCRLIRLDRNRGRSRARNLGAAEAGHEILVFIDADVVIPENALSLVADFFAGRPDVSAVSGLLDDACPFPDFSASTRTCT